MPNITLTWQPHFVSATQIYGNNAWMTRLEWRRNDNNTLLLTSSGLYVIENPLGTRIYVGRATNIRDRFNGRSDAIQEFGLVPAVVFANHRVRIARVNPTTSIALAEQWLVRFLYLADQAAVVHTLQNVLLTNAFNAPNDGVGLGITNAGSVPPYLNAAYNYAQGVQI